jgi:TPR repeat protein
MKQVLLMIALVAMVGCGATTQKERPTPLYTSIPKNTDAQVKLAYKYFSGIEVTLNYTKAAELFKIAAEAGNSDAQFALGAMVTNGYGVPRNHTDAAKWFEKAARQNHPGGQYLLGLCYKEGHGVVKEPAEAYKWMHLAAEQGYPEHIEARNHLALLLTPDVVTEGQRRAKEFRKVLQKCKIEHNAKK